ncbi:uncharacterized protein LOC110430302 isoform X6 [Sorghum bicolor]|uniref:uncharacterized protein LOC110430302 isoform X6 n=1 Tax=Sorghum bicolor TaxID=4558 RepID=UPI000B4256C4|nr:uncharacterized protein LOC110430302 isoform X6 [Sorghum bicolor]|eukprot:XP_021303460.1 uncharacterized protein LOC110430302 isoform X6 [Sorghum bicolor]
MGFRPTKAHRNSTVVIHSTRYSRSLPHRRIAAASGLSGASPVPGGRRCVLSASSLSAPLFAGHVLVLRWISDTGAEKVSLVRCRGAATRSEEDESQSPEVNLAATPHLYLNYSGGGWEVGESTMREEYRTGKHM